MRSAWARPAVVAGLRSAAKSGEAHRRQKPLLQAGLAAGLIGFAAGTAFADEKKTTPAPAPPTTTAATKALTSTPPPDQPLAPVPAAAKPAVTPADSKPAAAPAAPQAFAAPSSEPSEPTPTPEAPAEPPRPSFIDADGNIRTTYVLIGAGTASYSAMKGILARDRKAQIVIIGDEDAQPYSRPPLSKELWLQDAELAASLHYKDWAGKERSLFYEKDTHFTTVDGPGSSNVVLLKGRKATLLNVDDQYVQLDNGARVYYKKVLIATGATPKELEQAAGLPAATRAHVTTYRNVADFRHLEEVVKSAKRVLVVGGGFLGSELSFALAAHGRPTGLAVTQVFHEDGNMGRVFPKYLSNWTTAKMRQEGVNALPKTTIASMAAKDGDPNTVLVTLSDGRTLEFDHVVVAIGVEPNVELAREAGLELDEARGGIIVNAELESRSNVFAAGDVSSYHDIALGRRRVEHYDHAVLTGRTAGENMAGARRPYKHQSMFWSDLGPHIGYEAVGVIDSRLQCVGVWAKASAADTPKAATASPDNIRNAAQTPGALQSSDAQATQGQQPAADGAPTTTAVESEEFGKGVVFYLRNKRVVGVLLWNHFGQLPLARRIIREGKTFEDLSDLAKVFRLHTKSDH